MVNAGGDIAVVGTPGGRHDRPWRIGIRDPWDAMRIVAKVDVLAAVATSGTYERGEHVIDPHSGAPVSAQRSATVTGPGLAIADALATGLLAGGARAIGAIADLDDYEALLINLDGSASMTPGFPLIRMEPGRLVS